MSYLTVMRGLSGSVAVPFRVNSSGSLFSTPEAENSVTNITTTPLLAGTTWSGSAERNNMPDVMVSCKTDQDGILYFDFSNDGQNWDTFPVSGFTVTAGVHEFHTAVKGPRYFRARLTNTSAANQTYLRLYTYYVSVRQGNLPLNSSITSDADATIVRSVQTGESPTGTYINAKTDGVVFSTSASLGSGVAYTSSIFSTDGFSQIETTIYADQPGTLTGQWFKDAAGTQIIRTFTRPYQNADTDSAVYFSSPVFGPYLKYTYTNNSVAQSDFYFSLKALVKPISGQVIGLKDFIPANVVANLGRNILVGETDGGQFKNVPVTQEGHLEVAIHGPRLPFGSIHTERLTPIFQADAVYGINTEIIETTTTSSGTVIADDSTFRVSTGIAQYGFGSLQSVKRLRYRPGQGVVARFTARFTTGVTGSYQVAGIGHAEDGLYIGYSGSKFGILYNHHGRRDIHELRITTASTTTENVTIRLGSKLNSVAVSNSGSIYRTAYEISQGTYDGWKAYPYSSSIIFVADSVGQKTGLFALTATTAGGVFSELRAGSAVTESFIPQAEWNADTMDGSGSSGVSIDPTKGNIFQIGLQYLGYGALTFACEVAPDGNNTDFNLIHTIALPNTLTRTSFSNPSFPFTVAAASYGSTTNLQTEVASFAGFIEGMRSFTGPRVSYNNTITTAGSSNYHTLFTILNPRYFNGKANQAVINVLDVAGAVKHTQPVSLFLIKNASLVGIPLFTTGSSNSCALLDTSATTAIVSRRDQIIWVGQLGETGNIEKTFSELESIDIQPGDTLTLAARTNTGVAAYVAGTINTREDL